jgi:hypothetical protein
MKTRSPEGVTPLTIEHRPATAALLARALPLARVYATPPFNLSAKARTSVESIWFCVLTPSQISRIEEVCTWVTRQTRIGKLVPGGNPSHGDWVQATKRRKAIAQRTSELLELLEADQFEFSGSTSLCFEDMDNIIEQLPRLKAVAERAVYLTNRASTRKGNPGSNDPWTSFISELIAIYNEVTLHLKATAVWSDPKGRYDSRFLRGMLEVHDDLPEDIRRPCKKFLGSRANEIIKKQKTHMTS